MSKIREALIAFGVEFTNGKRGAVKMKPTFELDVSLEGSDIIITHGRDFRAVYYKPAGSPQLILRQQCDDHELLAAVWMAAKDKARKLGWIV